MPFFNHNNARIYFEDTGTGDPVIATHGLLENTTYWSRTGITPGLAGQFRVIAMDMRAHGRTMESDSAPGYDIETCMDDIEALADHLGLERFHIISHSTGGFIAVNLAMQSHRVAGLVLTGTASATTPIKHPGRRKIFYDRLAKMYENNSWEEILDNLKAHPFPFFLGIAKSPQSHAMWEILYEIIKIGNGPAIARFIRSFYTDPDPKVEKLRRIPCPTRILVGEKDGMFMASSRLMAKEIPDATLEIIEGAGHMLAIERPDKILDSIQGFLSAHPI